MPAEEAGKGAPAEGFVTQPRKGLGLKTLFTQRNVRPPSPHWALPLGAPPPPGLWRGRSRRAGQAGVGSPEGMATVRGTTPLPEAAEGKHLQEKGEPKGRGEAEAAGAWRARWAFASSCPAPSPCPAVQHGQLTRRGKKKNPRAALPSSPVSAGGTLPPAKKPSPAPDWVLGNPPPSVCSRGRGAKTGTVAEAPAYLRT